MFRTFLSVFLWDFLCNFFSKGNFKNDLPNAPTTFNLLLETLLNDKDSSFLFDHNFKHRYNNKKTHIIVKPIIHSMIPQDLNLLK